MKLILDEPISREAIRRTLKKQLRPHRSDYWRLLKKEDPEFIAYMDEKPYHVVRRNQRLMGYASRYNKNVDSEYDGKGALQYLCHRKAA